MTRTRLRVFRWLAIALVVGAAASGARLLKAASDSPNQGGVDPSLNPQLKAGQSFGTVFSRTIAIRGEGFAEITKRISGTAVYRAHEAGVGGVALDLRWHYDGREPGSSTVGFNPKTLNQTSEGKDVEDKDASGFLFNPWLWGRPSGPLQPGARWTVHLPTAWELGGVGDQEVRVVSSNPAAREVTLEREGRGEGAFDGEKDTLDIQLAGKTTTAKVAPGASHWLGWTRFREGVILSDVLLVERALTLTVPDHPPLSAHERQYILLNAMPMGPWATS